MSRSSEKWNLHLWHQGDTFQQNHFFILDLTHVNLSHEKKEKEKEKKKKPKEKQKKQRKNDKQKKKKNKNRGKNEKKEIRSKENRFF